MLTQNVYSQHTSSSFKSANRYWLTTLTSIINSVTDLCFLHYFRHNSWQLSTSDRINLETHWYCKALSHDKQQKTAHAISKDSQLTQVKKNHNKVNYTINFNQVGIFVADNNINFSFVTSFADNPTVTGCLHYQLSIVHVTQSANTTHPISVTHSTSHLSICSCHLCMYKLKTTKKLKLQIIN